MVATRHNTSCIVVNVNIYVLVSKVLLKQGIHKGKEHTRLILTDAPLHWLEKDFIFKMILNEPNNPKEPENIFCAMLMYQEILHSLMSDTFSSSLQQ